ncbi:MAG: RagB/SusD family nutrient uptake outer membrane protein [Agriterribacter sp.]
MNKLNLRAGIITMLVMLCSCKKILEPKPVGTNTLQSLVTTSNGITALTNGMYSPLYKLYDQTMQRLTDLASDDGWTWRNELETDIFIASPTYRFTKTAWTEYYRIINYANNILDNIDNVQDFPDEATKNSVRGQALFMRAFSYFNLVRLFGGVPLIEKQILVRSDAELPRVAIGDVYTLIKNDLTNAITLLPTTYGGAAGMEKGRPTTYAASALKSAVHLELEEWDEVIAASSAVIGNGALLQNYADYFNGKAENNAGSLFEVQYNNLNPAPISSAFAPAVYQGSALILPTDDDLEGKGGGPSSGGSFVQSYEPGDLRKNVTIATYGLPNFIDASKPNGTLFCINKFYNAVDPVGQSPWNYPLLRYAEVLLTRAEALNEKAYAPQGEAFELLNEVRSAAGLEELTAADLPSQSAFRDTVRHERRMELAFECIRYFDLNRWGIMQSRLQPQLDFLGLTFPSQWMITHPVTGKQYFLYPIPETEFINNASLGDQNPGY